MRIVLLPLVLYLANMASGFLCVFFLARAPTQSLESVDDALARTVLALEIIMLVLPVVTSALIALRLWENERRVSTYRSGSLSSLIPIAKIVVESAAFYVAALLTMVILYGLNNPGFFIVGETITPIVSITFCGLITRVGVYSFKVQFDAAQDGSNISSTNRVERNRSSYLFFTNRLSVTGREGHADLPEAEAEAIKEPASERQYA